MPETIPTTKIEAALFLSRVEEYLGTDLHYDQGKGRPVWLKDLRTYDDLKARQLCSALADSLIAESRIESWMADLGTGACCASA